MKVKFILSLSLVFTVLLVYSCTSAPETNTPVNDSAATVNYGGYSSQEKWGEHLVVIGGCGDCHTPKKMTAKGPEPDMDRSLAGSPNPALLPVVMPGQIEKGMAATVDETAWVGPWGKSYSANISSDSSGIGNWTEDQFMNCIRKGLSKGLPGARPLMPPMPWQGIAQMTDNELKAVFAYLKSTKPVHNIVPQYEPPMAMK